MPTMLDHALSMASGGHRVFPVHYPIRLRPTPACSCSKGAECKHIGKHPATEHGFTDASDEKPIIRRLWQRDNNYNIGLPTGANSFDVLDEDVQHQGDVTLRHLVEQHGPLPSTPTSKTGGGGHHYLYQHIPGARNDNRGKIGHGLDFKTDGGYIVAPPSLHASGNRYTWESSDLPIAPAPEWLIRVMRGGDAAPQDTIEFRRPRRKPDFWYNLARGDIAEGGRSDALTSLTGLLLEMRGLDPRLAIRLIYGYNTECCRPPLSRDEIATIISSITKKITH